MPGIFNHFSNLILILLVLLKVAIVIESAPLFSGSGVLIEMPDTDSHVVARRAFLPIANTSDMTKNGGSKDFGVGNNFVRHLRLLSRMSKRRRPFYDNQAIYSEQYNE